jgi:hypothetical protein
MIFLFAVFLFSLAWSKGSGLKHLGSTLWCSRLGRKLELAGFWLWSALVLDDESGTVSDCYRFQHCMRTMFRSDEWKMIGRKSVCSEQQPYARTQSGSKNP